MKIYTKKGDNGETSTLGGSRLVKHHIKIEAYGTVDELNAYLGMLRDQEISQAIKNEVILIQDRLFSIGSYLASDQDKKDQRLPDLKSEFIEDLERQIDKMDELLPVMKNFILPGGHPAVSVCHISRCVCRRAERRVSELGEIERINPVILPFLNRLSDYLFMLGRKISLDLHAKEIPWIPNK
ncbi:MAG TPA: cob(I)yrinic acid a,c-diamide adenosyltransferase [Flavobacteriales bacterium]|nr:cob(I)yrinic acid a,c-diamide adenosyltransferase [Flavobacteriales bacterium]